AELISQPYGLDGVVTGNSGSPIGIGFLGIGVRRVQG
ncbi:MAG: hypothetical protein ACI8QS_003092, partial [Planctomycetota bacterium]